ncbi:hypothetical protein VTL71DRAFT_99 [Oculimacula yallundae]|uniref:Uncharacterized protein n=1 Tax=Oculimacula yallundae TaxID=86028 RepID=A0ABR4CZ62_9HELO
MRCGDQCIAGIYPGFTQPFPAFLLAWDNVSDDKLAKSLFEHAEIQLEQAKVIGAKAGLNMFQWILGYVGVQCISEMQNSRPQVGLFMACLAALGPAKSA